MWKLAPETQSKRSKLFAVSLGARSALAPSGLCPVCFGRGLPFALTDFSSGRGCILLAVL